jgi:hypothetical protein
MTTPEGDVLTTQVATPRSDPVDLSAEIAARIERQDGDIVKCVRINGDHYRCNWWAAQATGGYDNPGMSGPLVTTHRVRQSQFLCVTRSASRGLVIKVLN